MKTLNSLRIDASRIWNAALRAVDPEPIIEGIVKRDGNILRVYRDRFHLDEIRKIWILGAGKAAAPMARAMEKALGRYAAHGIIVTKYGHGLPLKRLQVIEAGHPLPDSNSEIAGERFLSLAKTSVEADDLTFCLLSGGASALLASPASGITLADKIECTRLLMNAGADIYELNAVRKHLSEIKGGGLARWLAPARVVSLILSDVVGDDAGTIASGPLVPDATTFRDCINIIKKRNLWNRIPAGVKKRLQKGSAGLVAETPKNGDPIFQKSRIYVVAGSAQACTAAAQTAQRLGYHALVLTSRLEGDNAEAARFHMSVASEIAFNRRPVRRPACIISGGETTVRVTGTGTGGRNQDFTLRCIRQLAQLPAPCLAASIGTDGTDGSTEAAGAVADNTTLARSEEYGIRFLDESLNNNDSHGFFERLGGLIITGPTRTNVMDLHIVLMG